MSGRLGWLPFGLVQGLEENLVFIFFEELVKPIWSGLLGFRILKPKPNNIGFF